MIPSCLSVKLSLLWWHQDQKGVGMGREGEGREGWGTGWSIDVWDIGTGKGGQWWVWMALLGGHIHCQGVIFYIGSFGKNKGVWLINVYVLNVKIIQNYSWNIDVTIINVQPIGNILFLL